MSEQHKPAQTRKLLAVFVAVVIVVGVVGIVIIIDNTPTTYHYEAFLPQSDSRETRVTLSGIDDANITVSFVDEPGLWYRMDVTHYTSGKKHSVDNITTLTIIPLRVHLTSVTALKTVNIVLGTDVAHSIYISGENLNALVKYDNGAKISRTRCRFYGTGIFQFQLSEDVNITTGRLNVDIGDRHTDWHTPEHVVLDIDLPDGVNGHLSSPNATFIHNDWPVHYGDQWGTTSIDEPLIDIEIYYSMRVWASLRM